MTLQRLLTAALFSAFIIAPVATAKAARLSARAAWDAATASGDKVAAQAAEDAFMAAKVVEQEAGLAAAAATAAASVASSASAAAVEVAQEVASAASEAAQEVAQGEAIQEAAQDAQQAALDALWALEQMPGSSGMHTLEVTAAIRQLQSEMHGNEFNYMGETSYEAAMEGIAAAEAAGMNQIEMNKSLREKGVKVLDPNRMGPCGKKSC